MAARIALLTFRVPDPLTNPKLALMFVLPLPDAVAIPALPALLLIVATPGTDELQCVELVTSCVEPSLKVPIARNAWFKPKGVATADGLTAMETSEAGVTLIDAPPLIPATAAVIVVAPAPRVAANPPALTLATPKFPELQAAELVTSCVLPSVNMPLAANCKLVPSASDGLLGLTVIAASVAAVTVRFVDPETDAQAAKIVAVPVAIPLALPWMPASLLIVTIDSSDELHCTNWVMTCVLPSSKLPVATNGCLVPSGNTGIAGVTAIESNTADDTVRVDEPVISPELALTVVCPAEPLVTSPWLSTTATDGTVEFQFTAVVQSCVLPSLNVPVAVNGSVVAAAIVGFAGLIAMETRVAAVTVSTVEPLTEPAVAATVVWPRPTPLATPPPEMVATVGALELQVTAVVKSCVLPSLKVPVAVKVWLAPVASVPFCGLI
jgi:hypothetical protein